MLNQRLTDLLHRAQEGKCFHCGLPIDYGRKLRETPESWTREHVYPRCRSRGLRNNIVLAHGKCNRKRGSRAPTQTEILRTTALYASIGLVAFEPVDNLEKSRAGNDMKRLAKAEMSYWTRGKIKQVLRS